MSEPTIYRRRAGGPDVRAIRFGRDDVAGVLDVLGHEFGYASAQDTRAGDGAKLIGWGSRPLPTLTVYRGRDLLVHDPEHQRHGPLTVMSSGMFATIYERARSPKLI